MLKSLLERDYEFYAFTKGTQALRFLETTEPDLIILDIDMPEMNGYEMLQEIRKLYPVGVPVIYLTSNNEKNYVVKAASYGVNDYVVKPIQNNILMNKIEKLVME